jgi:hypothetical protein
MTKQYMPIWEYVKRGKHESGQRKLYLFEIWHAQSSNTLRSRSPPFLSASLLLRVNRYHVAVFIHGCIAYRCNTLGRCSSIDPILQVMLASNYGVFASSLLSLRSTFLWVSRAIFRYS